MLIFQQQICQKPFHFYLVHQWNYTSFWAFLLWVSEFRQEFINFQGSKKSKQSKRHCYVAVQTVRNKMHEIISNVFCTTGNHLNEMKFVKFNQEQNKSKNTQIEIGCEWKTLSIWNNRFNNNKKTSATAIIILRNVRSRHTYFRLTANASNE